VSVPRCTLLVVDDEHYILTTLAHLLSGDFNVLTADSAQGAQELFARHTIDLVLSDQKMPRTAGVQFLEWVRDHYPKTVRLLMTGYVELEDAIAAINRGHVYHYFLKRPRSSRWNATAKNWWSRCGNSTATSNRGCLSGRASCKNRTTCWSNAAASWNGWR
jgi:response regulator RpfG family c-di-GMP phosphodiesterase